MEHIFAKWNRVTHPRQMGGCRRNRTTRMPPKVEAWKVFPSLLVKHILLAGEKRSAIRWFLYCFPSRRIVTQEQAGKLQVLRYGEKLEQELELLRRTIRELITATCTEGGGRQGGTWMEGRTVRGGVRRGRERGIR